MASINLLEKNSAGSTLNTYIVDCTNVTIGWNNSLDAKPYANSLSAGVSEVQKNGFENPLYTLQGVVITGRSGALAYNDLVRLSKLTTGATSNYIILDIDYNDIQTYASGSYVEADFVTYTSVANVAIADDVTMDSFNINIGSDVTGNGTGDTVDYRVTFTYDDVTTSSVTGSEEATGNQSTVVVNNPSTGKIVTSVEIELKYTFGSGGDFVPIYYGYSYVPNNVNKLIDSGEASNGIKVVLKSFNFNIGLDKRFSTINRVMIGNIILQESS